MITQNIIDLQDRTFFVAAGKSRSVQVILWTVMGNPWRTFQLIIIPQAFFQALQLSWAGRIDPLFTVSRVKADGYYQGLLTT